MIGTVLITGAAKRIGRHLSLFLASAGYDIVIHHGHSDVESRQLADEIRRLHRKSFILKSDFLNPGGIEADFSVLPGDLEITCLINNAAIFEPLSFQESSFEEWNRHIAVNLTSPFLVSKWFFNRLNPGHQGRIINFLDWRALRPGADHFPYTVSKAALASMTKSLAVAMAPRISVNGIAFGAILPPNDGSSPEKMLNSVPFVRTAEMDEVNQTVLFLLQGPEYITGEIIHLDGGRHLI
jgi:NAD(P)-dependent dehydrogenase (short-subunit alcohol dehydrogenase family)